VIDDRQPFSRPTASVLMVCTEIEPTTVSALTTTRCASLGGQPAWGILIGGSADAKWHPSRVSWLRQLREAARADGEDSAQHSRSCGVARTICEKGQRGAPASASRHLHDEGNNLARRVSVSRM
jgi:hypothetical protein